MDSGKHGANQVTIFQLEKITLEANIKLDMEQSWDELNQKIVPCTKCTRLVEHREAIARGRKKAFLDWDYRG